MEKGSQEIGSGNNTETLGRATVPGVLTNWQLSLYSIAAEVSYRYTGSAANTINTKHPEKASQTKGK